VLPRGADSGRKARRPQARRPWTPARREILAFRLWSGRAAPDLLRADEAGGALLLERIEPGTPLADGASGEEIVRVARLLRALHALAASAASCWQLPPLADVVEDQITTAGAEAAARSPAEATALRPALERARHVASRLLESWDGDVVVLHGDLESKNILICHKRGLATIDPLACVGEPAGLRRRLLGGERTSQRAARRALRALGRRARARPRTSPALGIGRRARPSALSADSCAGLSRGPSSRTRARAGDPRRQELAAAARQGQRR